MDYESIPFCSTFPDEEKIELVDPENSPTKVLDLINEVILSTDPERIQTVLSVMCATLAQYDTETYRGKDFGRISSVIESWLEPLVRRGFIQFENITTRSGRPFLVIAPNVGADRKNINSLKNIVANPYSLPVETNRPLFHAHIDTVSPNGEFGSRKLYIDEDKNLIWGRGTADMLMSICSMIISLYQISKGNENLNFWFCISSNEEFPNLNPRDPEDSIFALSRIQPTILFELEPTPAQGGVFSTSIQPYTEYYFESYKVFPVKEILELQKLITGFISTNYNDSGFYILNGEKKPKTPKKLSNDGSVSSASYTGGFQNSFNPLGLEILSGIISQFYSEDFPDTGRTGLSGFIKIPEHGRYVEIIGAYATAATMIQWAQHQRYQNTKPSPIVVTFTLPSLGHGRHSPVEGTSLKDAAVLVSIIQAINSSPLCPKLES